MFFNDFYIASLKYVGVFDVFGSMPTIGNQSPAEKSHFAAEILQKIRRAGTLFRTCVVTSNSQAAHHGRPRVAKTIANYIKTIASLTFAHESK